jgi:hypothetical protein
LEEIGEVSRVVANKNLFEHLVSHSGLSNGRYGKPRRPPEPNTWYTIKGTRIPASFRTVRFLLRKSPLNSCHILGFIAVDHQRNNIYFWMFGDVLQDKGYHTRVIQP